MNQHLRFFPPLYSLSPQSWDVFFRNANAGAPPGAAYQSPLGMTVASLPQAMVGAQPNVEKLVEDHLAVQSLIRAYQVWPHTHTHIPHTTHRHKSKLFTHTHTHTQPHHLRLTHTHTSELTQQYTSPITAYFLNIINLCRCVLFQSRLTGKVTLTTHLFLLKACSYCR